jgi:hypothetical protein
MIKQPTHANAFDVEPCVRKSSSAGFYRVLVRRELDAICRRNSRLSRVRESDHLGKAVAGSGDYDFRFQSFKTFNRFALFKPFYRFKYSWGTSTFRNSRNIEMAATIKFSRS